MYTMNTELKKEVKLTQGELEFFKQFSTSDFCESGMDSVIWKYSIGQQFGGNNIAGIVTSLVRKGYIINTPKIKGDIDGVYSLTDLAKNDNRIKSIFGEGYFIEFNGEFYQSVFPSSESDKSNEHDSVNDAIGYMVEECGVEKSLITIL